MYIYHVKLYYYIIEFLIYEINITDMKNITDMIMYYQITTK